MAAIAAISVYAILLTAVFTSLGLSFRKLFGARSVDLDGILADFWVGFAIIICFLQVWHLFFAISWRALAILSLTSCAAWYWNLPALASLWQRLPRRRVVVGCLCSLVVLFWIADSAAGPGDAYDSGAYQVPTVLWNRTYPVVPGLANLHDRLAFNSSSLLYAATLEWGPWNGRANHIAHAALIWVLFLRILLSAYRALRRNGSGEDYRACIFDLVLLAPAVSVTTSIGISSLLTDVPVALVLFIACSQLHAMLTRAPTLESDGYEAVTVVVLASLAVCLKGIAIVIAPLLIAAALGFLVATEQKPAGRAATWSAAIALLMIVPWMLHGAILSGYPLYPSTFGALPVDWRSPIELANATHLWVVVTSRSSMAHGLAWVSTWQGTLIRWAHWHRSWQWGTGIFGVMIPSIIAITGLVVRVCVQRLKGRGKDRSYWLEIALVTAAAIWFWMAPSPRFGFAIFWSLAAVSLATASRHLAELRVPSLFLAASMICLPILLPWPHENPAATLLRRVFVRPGPDHGFYPYPKTQTDTFRTQTGVLLNVPKNGNLCFNAPLPCTPHPAPNLRLAHARDGRPKFITEGPWRQINWPNAIKTQQMKAFLQFLASTGQGPQP